MHMLKRGTDKVPSSCRSCRKNRFRLLWQRLADNVGWVGCVSLAGWIGHSLGKVTVGLGLLTGAGGLLTLIPILGDSAGAVFGLGAIAWFIAIGLKLLRHS